MKNWTKIVVSCLIILVSLSAFAKPPHAKGNGFKAPHAKRYGVKAPPAHAKAWGKKYDWQNMSKAERRALKDSAKNKDEDQSVLGHAKALGRALLN